jgi:hypothetical protein
MEASKENQQEEPRIGDVALLLAESGLAIEDLADRLGISGMTVRRWFRKPKVQALPLLYARSYEFTVLEMVCEGLLDGDSRCASKVSRHSSWARLQSKTNPKPRVGLK